MRHMRLVLVATLALALVGAPSALVMAQEEAATGPSGEGTELLVGVEFVTEELEPGVYRVLSDGVRELTWPVAPESFEDWQPPGVLYREQARTTAGIVANEDGVWLRRPEGILRLGEAEPIWVPEDARRTREFTVISDGTLYREGRSLRVLRDGAWVEVKVPGRLRLAFVKDVRVAPDGTLWALGHNGKSGPERRWPFVRHDADGWSRVKWAPGAGKSGGPSDWVPGPGGVLYVRQGEDVLRFDGQRWETLGRVDGDIIDLMVGADGTAWLEVSAPGGERRYLRADADGWTMHDAGGRGVHALADSVVATDGALWYTATGDPMSNGGCDGVVRTDGTTTTRFLEDRCVHDMAVGPEGTLWAAATWWFGNYFSPESVSPLEIFAITPEAWSAAE